MKKPTNRLLRLTRWTKRCFAGSSKWGTAPWGCSLFFAVREVKPGNIQAKVTQFSAFSPRLGRKARRTAVRYPVDFSIKGFYCTYTYSKLGAGGWG
jgi:hypothetical protein